MHWIDNWINILIWDIAIRETVGILNCKLTIAWIALE